MDAPKRILLVDDDPYILLSLEFLMKKAGYKVFVARNGTEALDSIQAAQPDIVLLDIMMPDVDGYAICRHIRATPELAGIKVVFLSAKTKEQDIQKGMEAGADRYIKKPFSTKDLVKQVEELLA